MMMNSVKAQIGQDLLAAPKRLPHFAAAALASSFLGQKIYNQNLRRPPLSKQVFGDGGILSPQQKQQNCVGLLLKNYYCVSVGNFHEKQQRRQQQSCALAESEIPVERECVDDKGIIRSEFPSVPVQSEPVTDTLQAAILRHHQQDPNQLAFICAENPADRITYGDFLRQCHFVADFLATMDFGKGDCVGVVTRNSWQFFAAFMAAAMRGGCITGANAQLTNAEIARQFEIAKCRMVFCEESLLEKMCDVKNICPGIEHLVLIPSKFPHEPLANLPPNIHNWAELEQARPSNGSVFSIKRAPSDIKIARELAFLPFSSGTTGPGKGVMLSHKSVGTMLRILNSHFTERVVQRMDPDWDWKKENSIMILPFYHIYGFMNGLNNLLNGGTGILFRKFDLELFCRIVQDYKIKQVSLVPPILVYLAKCPQLTAQYDLSSLRMIMTGAAPLGEDLCREVKRQIPSIEQISQGYGMTEQSMCSHMPVFGWQNHRAAGRLNPNFEMKIVDVQTREPVPLGQLGEICTRSPTNMRGYLNNPEATAETIDEDGWLRTGDIGYCDEQGWTYVVDRLKELIKVKGLQVAPAELEDTLLAHPSIADCAVVGVPDEMCGEVPKAFVVRAANAPSLDEEEVKQFLKDRVAAYKQLKYVQFVDAIPKSPAGKILRRSLRA